MTHRIACTAGRTSFAASRCGAALGVGGRATVLTNEKGAVLSLTGQQIGLQINADLSGLAILMR